MTRLSSLYGNATTIRRDRLLTHDELMRVVPGVFRDDKHTSRSASYTYIPTITVLESLKREGFEPFFACQARVRDPDRREYSKHLLRLRRAGQITQKEVQKSYCSTTMTAPVRTACCRVCTDRFAVMDSSAVSRLATLESRTRATS